MKNNPAKTPLTPEQSKKRRNKIIKHVVIWSAVAAVLATVYWAAIKFVLADYQNMRYLTFSYVVRDDGGQEEVRIDQVNRDKKYPSKFVVPKKLLGRPVTTIGEDAFASLDRLKEVVLPNTIHTLEDRVFYNCTNLSKIKLSENIVNVGINAITNTPFYEEFPDGFLMLGKVLYTYKGKFPDNTVLIEVDAPNEQELIDSGYNVVEYNGDVANVGSGLFADQEGIVQAYLPEALPKISEKLFLNNPNLEKVVIGPNVTRIEAGAFENTPKLSDINFNDLDKVNYIGPQAFKNSRLTGEIKLSEGVEEIAEEAFASNPAMTKFVATSNVTYIGERAFMDTPNLSEITNLDNVKEIDQDAFNGSGLVRFDIPKEVTLLKPRIFQNAKKLEEVTMHEGFSRTGEVIDEEGNVVTDEDGNPVIRTEDVYLQGFRDDVFANCESLKTIAVRDDDNNLLTPTNEINFIDKLRLIGPRAFSNTPITKVVLTPSMTRIEAGTFADAINLSTVEFKKPPVDSDITYNLTRIGSRAFFNNKALKGIDLPETLTTISDEAFLASGLESITIPEGVTVVNSFTFKDNVDLANVNFSTNLRLIEKFAFENCTSLTSLTLPESIEAIHEGAFAGTTNLTSIIIPNTANITQDNLNGAFKDAIGLTSFDVPDKYEMIFDNMFEGATNLTSVNFTENSELKFIGQEAFKNTPALTDIKFPKDNLVSVGQNAFEGNGWYEAQPDGLTYLNDEDDVPFIMYKYKGEISEDNSEIVIPEGIEIIGDGAFINQVNLKKITLPSTLKYIPFKAFEGASNLEEVVINEGSVLKEIGENAFYDTRNLVSFTLPNTVTKIKRRAFNNNESLTTFTVPLDASLHTIEAYAFAGCKSLLEFYLPESINRIEGFAFQGCTSLTFTRLSTSLDPNDKKNNGVFLSNWNSEGRPIVVID